LKALILLFIGFLLLPGCFARRPEAEPGSVSHLCTPPESVRVSARKVFEEHNVPAPPETGAFAAFEAVLEEKNENFIHLYLRSGIINHEENGGSLLHYGAANENLSLLRKGFLCGLEPDKKDEAGFTPLHLAVKNQAEVAANLLLENGADVNAVDANEQTPLHLASAAGSMDLVELFLRHEAKVDAADRAGRTPLFIALEERREEVASRLVDAGAAVDEEILDVEEAGILKGGTLLHLAVYREDPGTVRILLELGADPSARTIDDWTPTHIAAWRGERSSIRELAEAGADVDVIGGTGLDGYIFEARTPLHIAAYEGEVAAVEELLRQGADPTIRTREGWMARHLADYFDYSEVVRLLEQAEQN